MHGARWWELVIAGVLICVCMPARAQTDQFLPEVDSYTKLHNGVRFTFQAKQTREAGEPVQAELGPTVDFYLRPWIRLAEVNKFDLDDTKPRLLTLGLGYRYLPPANGGAATNRMEPVMTMRFPVTKRLLLTDRNRFDLDWKSGDFAWRYRNRVQVQLDSYYEHQNNTGKKPNEQLNQFGLVLNLFF
jgi:hypothetical protein